MSHYQWAVFDLDGVLADCTHRVPLALAKDWPRFHAGCPDDGLYRGEASLAVAWVRAGGKVCYNTGRTEANRVATREWLTRHQLPFGILLMRGDTDTRPSTESKLDNLRVLEQLWMAPGDVIRFIMEDQDKLVALWRSLGYTCLQPRPGVY